MNYYPPLANIDVGTFRDLRVIASNIQETNDYLELEACPYEAEVVLHLKNLFASPIPSAQTEDTEALQAVSQEDFDPIKACVDQLNELISLKRTSKGLSTGEKIQTFKLITSQLEKLTEVKKEQERVEEYQHFKTTLFDTLERHLSPSQIGEFMTDFEETTKNHSRNTNL